MRAFRITLSVLCILLFHLEVFASFILYIVESIAGNGGTNTIISVCSALLFVSAGIISVCTLKDNRGAVIAALICVTSGAVAIGFGGLQNYYIICAAVSGAFALLFALTAIIPKLSKKERLSPPPMQDENGI